MDINKILAFNRIREEELKRRGEVQQRIDAWRERWEVEQPPVEQVPSGNLFQRFARLATLFLS